jgi:hypothetical protein
MISIPIQNTYNIWSSKEIQIGRVTASEYVSIWYVWGYDKNIYNRRMKWKTFILNLNVA